METKQTYFISGASGVGKTSTMLCLKPILPSKFEVHDFDERGVPNNADHEWRLKETLYWINLGKEKSKENITLVLFGFFNPDELKNIENDFLQTKIGNILLDGGADIIEQRLRNRNTDSDVKTDLERVVGSAEDFIQNNSKFVPVLRDIFKKYKYPIIDTSYLNPEAVAEELAQIIK